MGAWVRDAADDGRPRKLLPATDGRPLRAWCEAEVGVAGQLRAPAAPVVEPDMAELGRVANESIMSATEMRGAGGAASDERGDAWAWAGERWASAWAQRWASDRPMMSLWLSLASVMRDETSEAGGLRRIWVRTVREGGCGVMISTWSGSEDARERVRVA